jgi:hypothetical protein
LVVNFGIGSHVISSLRECYILLSFYPILSKRKANILGYECDNLSMWIGEDMGT